MYMYMYTLMAKNWLSGENRDWTFQFFHIIVDNSTWSEIKKKQTRIVFICVPNQRSTLKKKN